MNVQQFVTMLNTNILYLNIRNKLMWYTMSYEVHKDRFKVYNAVEYDVLEMYLNDVSDIVPMSVVEDDDYNAISSVLNYDIYLIFNDLHNMLPCIFTPIEVQWIDVLLKDVFDKRRFLTEVGNVLSKGRLN